MIGRTLGHYRIESRLGEGGMGVVYRAFDLRLNRAVALKVIAPGLMADPDRRLRFQREAQAAAALNHPNICTIHEVDTQDGVDFLVMELLEGNTLRERLAHRPLPLKTLLPIAVQVGDALDAAHTRGVLHRDLKPENIWITGQGTAKVLDFGLAKITRPEAERGGPAVAGAPGADGAAELHSYLETISRELTLQGKVFGTVTYMSPEQARGEPVDHRSDLFSFGVVLYEMAAGRPPFGGKTDAELLAAIIRDEPQPLGRAAEGAPPELERIITKALEKDPADRYHHADDMVTDLRHLKRISDSGVQAVRTPGMGVAAVPVARGRWLSGLLRTRAGRWGAAAVAAAALLAAGVHLWRTGGSGGAFHSGDTVFVADFAGATERTDLVTAVRDAVETMLAESRFLDVVRGERLATLKEKHLPGGAGNLDADQAQRLCAAGKVAGFLSGSLAAEGTGYTLRAELRRCGSERPVLSFSASAPAEEEILSTIHTMVLRVRKGAGEADEALSMAWPPTTRSLQAFQAFAAAGRILASEKEGERLALYKRAVEIDPGFVAARSALAVRHWNLGHFREWRKEAEETNRRCVGLPDQVRLKCEVDALDAIYDFEAEAERLKIYTRLYPFEAYAWNSLGAMYSGVSHDDPGVAEPYHREACRLVSYNCSNLARDLADQGKSSEAEKLVAEFEWRGGDPSEVADSRMYARVSRGDWRGMIGALDRPDQTLGPIYAGHWRLWALLMAGRLAEAEKQADMAYRLAVRESMTRDIVGIGVRQAWFAVRRTGQPTVLAEEVTLPALESMLYLPDLANDSVWLGLPGPLEEAIREHERNESGSQVRFVREELDFARGCLALMQGQKEEALRLLEPLARGSNLGRRHWALGRAYEEIGKLAEAAAAYEEMFRNRRHRRWSAAPWMILDQFRLARVYDRLGDVTRARHWYGYFVEDWKDGDPDIPELIEARQRLAALGKGA